MGQSRSVGSLCSCKRLPAKKVCLYLVGSEGWLLVRLQFNSRPTAPVLEPGHHLLRTWTGAPPRLPRWYAEDEHDKSASDPHDTQTLTRSTQLVQPFFLLLLLACLLLSSIDHLSGSLGLAHFETHSSVATRVCVIRLEAILSIPLHAHDQSPKSTPARGLLAGAQLVSLIICSKPLCL